MTAIELGERIADMRNAKNMTQAELAEKLNVTTQAISKWETGAGFPDIQIIPQLADIFNTTTDILFGRTDKQQKVLVYNVCASSGEYNKKLYDMEINDKYIAAGWKVIQTQMSSDSEQTYMMVVLER